MHYKILYIIFCSSIIFSQSFFNRVLPEESYCGDAKSMAIGNTCLLTSTNSSVIISNPSKISSFKGKYAIDLNIDFKSLTERRSIVFKDEWEESLGETDYVFNQNNLFNHSFGLLFFSKIEVISPEGYKSSFRASLQTFIMKLLLNFIFGTDFICLSLPFFLQTF